MKTETYYDRTYERWVTPVVSHNRITLYLALGTTKYESNARAEFIDKALNNAQELSDLNLAHHESRHEFTSK